MTSSLFRSPLAVVLAAAVFGVAACDDSTDPAPSGETSTAEVRAYVDMDADGAYTPEFDEPVTGATITLTPAETGTVLSATTDADGIASFAEVEPGSYTAEINAEATPADADLISAAAPTVVAPFEGADLTAEFRYAYDFDAIAAVKELELGSEVFLYGVVTAGQGVYRTAGDNLYLQDATSGIQVFGMDSELGLTEGTAIRLRGELDAFAGEMQVTNPTDVVVVGTAAAPAPREVTGAEINALTYEGELVVTRMARVVSVGGGTGASYNVTFLSEDEETILARIESGVGATVTRDTWELGAGYDITGVLGSYNGNAQIKPRGLSDIDRVADPVAPPEPEVVTLAEARALDDNTLVQVEGVVTVGTGSFRDDNIYLQDASGGMQVFGVTGPLEIGDSLRIVGTMGTFGEERQVTNPTVEDLGTGTIPTPLVLTVAEVNSLDHEGELVTVENLAVTSIGNADTSGRYNVTFEDAGGTEMQLRIEAGVADVFPHATAFTVGTTYTVTGVVGQYNGTAQVKPRMASDVE